MSVTAGGTLRQRASVGSPSPLTIVLGIVLTGLQVANQVVLADYPAIKAAVAVAITFLGGIGVSALFGPRLVAVFHISPRALVVIGAAITAANGVLSIVVISTLAHTIATAVLTLVGVLFLGTPPVQAVAVPVGRRALRWGSWS